MDIYSVLEEIKMNQKREVRMIKCLYDDGTMVEFPVAKQGNSTYAWRTGKQIDNYRQSFLHEVIDKNILFFTLTVPYGKTFYGCKESWEFVPKALSSYIKALKKMGMEKYLATLESTYEGGCHAHIITRWNKPLQTRKVNDRFYLADRELSKKIRDKWYDEWKKKYPLIPFVKLIQIRVCPDLSESERAFGYVTKCIGNGSNIETAIYNVEHGIKNKLDVKKLFTNYWAGKLNYRLYRTSKGLGKT